MHSGDPEGTRRGGTTAAEQQPSYGHFDKKAQNFFVTCFLLHIFTLIIIIYNFLLSYLS
jgi:hypothetical protein